MRGRLIDRRMGGGILWRKVWGFFEGGRESGADALVGAFLWRVEGELPTGASAPRRRVVGV